MEDHRKPKERGDTFQSSAEGSALGRGKDRNKGEEEKQERHPWVLGRENGNTLRKLHHLIISLFSMN